MLHFTSYPHAEEKEEKKKRKKKKKKGKKKKKKRKGRGGNEDGTLMIPDYRVGRLDP
jgi:hypothetical protein